MIVRETNWREQKASREEDKRPRKGGWAPGDYFCKCAECGTTFIGDKRAVVCAPCAYA